MDYIHQTYELAALCKTAKRTGALPAHVIDVILRDLYDIAKELSIEQDLEHQLYSDSSPVIITYGRPTTVETATRSISARYALVELHNVIVSHSPINFSPRPDYPFGCQQRDYSHDSAEQLKITQGANSFNPAYLLTDTPTATDGPPVVTRAGIVLGGNGRTMMFLLASPENQQQYIKDLHSRLGTFGLEESSSTRYGMPFLVRVVDIDIQDCALYSNILNTNLTQKSDFTTHVVSLSRQLSNRTLEIVADLFVEYDLDSLAQLFQNSTATRRLIAILRSAEIITSRNQSEFLEPATGNVSDLGKLSIERILLGAILNEKHLIDAARSYTVHIIRAITAFIRMKSLPAEWNLIDDIKTALLLEHERRATGERKEDFISQPTIERESIPERVLLVWELLDTGARKFTTAIKHYLSIAEEETGGSTFDFAVPRTPIDVLRFVVKREVLGDNDDIELYRELISALAMAVHKGIDTNLEQMAITEMIDIGREIGFSSEDFYHIYRKSHDTLQQTQPEKEPQRKTGDNTKDAAKHEKQLPSDQFVEHRLFNKEKIIGKKYSVPFNAEIYRKVEYGHYHTPPVRYIMLKGTIIEELKNQLRDQGFKACVSHINHWEALYSDERWRFIINLFEQTTQLKSETWFDIGTHVQARCEKGCEDTATGGFNDHDSNYIKKGQKGVIVGVRERAISPTEFIHVYDVEWESGVKSHRLQGSLLEIATGDDINRMEFVNNTSGAIQENQQLPKADILPDIQMTDVIPLHQVRSLKHKYLRLQHHWQNWLGKPVHGHSIFLWGAYGTGKSSLAMLLGQEYGRAGGRVLLATGEEHISRFTDRAKRLRITNKNFDLMTTDNLAHIRYYLDTGRYYAVIIDSASVMDATEEDLMRVVDDYPDMAIIYIAHATKEGQPVGSTKFPHKTDIVIQTKQGGIATTTKNRFGETPRSFSIFNNKKVNNNVLQKRHSKQL